MLRRGQSYTCSCCGHATLSERGGYEICREYRWEDDSQDDHDSEVVRGPDGALSLDAARSANERHGWTRGVHRPSREHRQLASGTCGWMFTR
jgi:hypothetical protein